MAPRNELWGDRQVNKGKTTQMARREFEEFLGDLMKGAEEITPAATYKGLRYRRPDGTTFGLRRSTKNGLTIDIIDSLGNPALKPGARDTLL